MAYSTGDDLGRRRYLLHRDKAVEEALERIRRAEGSGWETLTPEERTGLKTALSEIWENCGQGRWQQFCFSALNKAAVLELIRLVREAQEHHQSVCSSKERIEALLSISPGNSRRH